MNEYPRVFVLDGYTPRGGGFMKYELGRICYERFGATVYIVPTVKTVKKSPFHYPIKFPTITLDQMKSMIRPNDLLISASKYLLGHQLPCRKLMYLQGVNTFKELDKNYDYYVSASTFIQNYIKKKYNQPSIVIHPYVNHQIFQYRTPWNKRLHKVLILQHKVSGKVIGQFIRKYRQKYPNTRLRFTVVRSIKQGTFANMLDKHKYYLSLSTLEGFGLPSLEAMASGCAVIGFDGYGGDYFKHGRNAWVARSGDYEQLIDYLHIAEHNPALANRIAKCALEDSYQFSKQVFEQKWVQFLSSTVFKQA